MMEDTLQLRDFDNSVKLSKCAKRDKFRDHNKKAEMSMQAKERCIQAI